MHKVAQLTRRRTGPFRLDVCRPVRHEGGYDLALRSGLVQKLVIVRIALRYTYSFRKEERNTYESDDRIASRNERMKERKR